MRRPGSGIAKFKSRSCTSPAMCPGLPVFKTELIKETINRVKRKKIPAIRMSEKGLISKIHKKLLQLHNTNKQTKNKQKNIHQKLDKGLKETFLQRRHADEKVLSLTPGH